MSGAEIKNEDVCILVPTLNEATTVGEVVRGFKSLGFENVLVIDGDSTDATREIAERAGAKVVVQQGKGKGTALRQAFKLFELSEAEVIVIIDGDGTYSPSEVGKLLAPIIDGEADLVIGNRFAYRGVFKLTHRIGNKFVNRLFGFGYGTKTNDILSGYRALTRDAVKKMRLERAGFEIEAEIAIEAVKRGVRIKEVPIKYDKRGGQSKLNFLRDGSKIAYTLYELTRTQNPIFYFGIIGVLFLLAGVLTGSFVVLEWFKSISHDLLTVLTALLVILGIQFFIFGLLGDFLVTLQKEVLEALRGKRR